MRFEGGRTLSKSGFDFALDASLRGIGGNEFNKEDLAKTARTARDAIAIPTDPVIVEIAERNLCHLDLAPGCFTLTNVYGIKEQVPYGASVEDWERIASGLLQLAMEENER